MSRCGEPHGSACSCVPQSESRKARSMGGSMLRWYLVRTKSGKEGSVRAQLRQCLPEVFLPTLKVRVRRWDHLVPTVVPLFPCYMFAMFNLECDLQRVSYTAGVRQVVRVGGEPVIVPLSIMKQLKERCALGPVELASKALRKGDPVMIADGPFCGFEAVFDRYLSGPRRVAILLSSITGPPLRMVLAANSLVSAEQA